MNTNQSAGIFDRDQLKDEYSYQRYNESSILKESQNVQTGPTFSPSATQMNFMSYLQYIVSIAINLTFKGLANEEKDA